MDKPLRKEDFSEEELARCVNDPVYFYNKYVKHKDDPDLKKEGYEEMMVVVKKFRDGVIKRKDIAYYPLTKEQIDFIKINLSCTQKDR